MGQGNGLSAGAFGDLPRKRWEFAFRGGGTGHVRGSIRGQTNPWKAERETERNRVKASDSVSRRLCEAESALQRMPRWREGSGTGEACLGMIGTRECEAL